MFGKRNIPVPQTLQHPGPDDDGVSRIIPKAMFTGKMGAFLKKVGQSADDPSNLVLTQELLDARIDRRREQQDHFLKSWNAKLPTGCEVIPWAMIPWSLWKGPHADFMFKNDLFPMDAWNTMLLPADERSALILNLPRHPRAAPKALEDAAANYLGDITRKVFEAHAKTVDDMSKTGSSDFGAFSDVVEKAKRDIVVVANYLAAKMFGRPAYDRHLAMFGASLGLNPSAPILSAAVV